jgi:hypothetical protein
VTRDGSLTAVIEAAVPPADPTPQWDDVLRRAAIMPNAQPATAARRDVHQRRGIIFRRRSRWTAIPAVAILAAVASATGALAYHFFGPSPGFTAGLSALEHLPPASLPTSLPPVALEHAAGAVGISPDQARTRLHLVRTGLTLGPGRSTASGRLYAFEGQPGTACIFLIGQGDTCLTPASVSYTRSVMPAIFSGYPGQTPALVALVADDVRSVDLKLGAKVRNITIVNNSVYADLTGLTSSTTISLLVTFDQGARTEILLPNPLTG